MDEDGNNRSETYRLIAATLRCENHSSHSKHVNNVCAPALFYTRAPGCVLPMIRNWICPGRTSFQVFQGQLIRSQSLCRKRIPNDTAVNKGDARDFLFLQFFKNTSFVISQYPSQMLYKLSKDSWYSNPQNKILFKSFTLTQLFTNFPAFYGIQRHYFIHKTSALVAFLSKLVPAHILTNLIFKSHFNITLPSMPINNCHTSVSIKLCLYFFHHYVSTLASSQKKASKIWILATNSCHRRTFNVVLEQSYNHLWAKITKIL